MYKYLTLIDDMTEMLVMMSSLPTCTIVFDKNAELLDINQLASDFLQIKNWTDYLNGKVRINTDYFYLQKTIEELKTGKTISNENLKFMRADNSIVQVKFNACMLYGAKSIFLFQFFEVKPSPTLDFPILLNSVFHDIQSLQVNLSELGASVLSGIENDPGVNDDSQENDLTQLLSIKQINLTRNEYAICELIAEQTPVKQIADILHKTPNNIYGTVKRITHKFNLKSRKELYLHLKELRATLSVSA
jgi:DNA-binding CsgD family transcriptional regulator